MADTVSAEIESRITGEPRTAYLATSRDDRPHVAPVWYLYEDGVFEIVTTGRKLANVRANPRVALTIEHAEAGDPEWTATFLGTATVVTDGAATREANARINRKYGAPDDAWDDNVLVRIEVATASFRTY
jgi:nitroimidazol reductase NimA-like FMN-containing flavoprotein (pyridoxamine 5'-phosphate oxidase superfamily)